VTDGVATGTGWLSPGTWVRWGVVGGVSGRPWHPVWRASVPRPGPGAAPEVWPLGREEGIPLRRGRAHPRGRGPGSGSNISGNERVSPGPSPAL
jgi:hypothetical protein